MHNVQAIFEYSNLSFVKLIFMMDFSASYTWFLQEDLEALRRLSQASSSSGAGPNQTFWLTHYPSLTITTNHRHLREVMSSAVAHVCGHLHTLGNTVFRMYGRHPSGHLELELGDFVGYRRYLHVHWQIDAKTWNCYGLFFFPLFVSSDSAVHS